jgi:hypothetical protein
MPTYKDITIQLVLNTTKVDCQRISHTIEIAGLHSKAGKRENKLLSAIPAIQPVRNENLRMASGFDTVQIHLLKLVKCTKGWTLLQK